MDVQSIIAARRDGRTHTQSELIDLARAAGELARQSGSAGITEYQLAAWLMAAYLRPLSIQETAWLTMAMADSGERMDLTGLPKPWVDKHSTGGVGDKTSIVLLPLLASCGLTVMKMSGRGLGKTGGTVDKLGSIPGFRVDLSIRELKDQALKIGLALTGQTPDLAPADKAMYALRDATATVDSRPLIVSSILSKKLAGGAETVVLDVKCGSGAFTPDLRAARKLVRLLKQTGDACGLNLRIAITDMDQPLGRAVGNVLEVREAIRVLSGEESRFSRLCVELAGITLFASGMSPNRASGEATARAAMDSGKAKEKAREWFLAQGATRDIFEDESAMAQASVVAPVIYEGPGGWIETIDANAVGSTVVDLGGGRKSKEDPIDVSVGIELAVEVGSQVQPGLPILTIHASDQRLFAVAEQSLLKAIKVSPTPIAGGEALLQLY